MASNLAVVYTNRIRKPAQSGLAYTTVGFWMLQQLVQSELAHTTVGFWMPQQPSPQPVQSGLAHTTVGCDLKSCRSIYYSHPRSHSKLDWH